MSGAEVRVLCLVRLRGPPSFVADAGIGEPLMEHRPATLPAVADANGHWEVRIPNGPLENASISLGVEAGISIVIYGPFHAPPRDSWTTCVLSGMYSAPSAVFL